MEPKALLRKPYGPVRQKERMPQRWRVKAEKVWNCQGNALCICVKSELSENEGVRAGGDDNIQRFSIAFGGELFTELDRVIEDGVENVHPRDDHHSVWGRSSQLYCWRAGALRSRTHTLRTTESAHWMRTAQVPGEGVEQWWGHRAEQELMRLWWT